MPHKKEKTKTLSKVESRSKILDRAIAMADDECEAYLQDVGERNPGQKELVDSLLSPKDLKTNHRALGALSALLKSPKRSAEPKKRSKTPLSKRKMFISALSLSALTTFLSVSPWGETIQNLIPRPIEFRVRQWLGRTPELAPNLKVLVVDDTTVQKIKREGLTLDQWALVLERLKAVEPQAVFIDKIFAIPAPDEESARFTSRVKALPFPVVAGSFVSPSEITGRSTIKLSDLTKDLLEPKGRELERLEDISWLKVSPGYPYGPADKLLPSFRRIGHVMYNGGSLLTPIVRLNEFQGLPAAPLVLGKNLYFKKGELFVNGAPVPLTPKGDLLINFLSSTNFFHKALKLRYFLDDADLKEALSLIPKGSTIVLAPSFFTGNTDFSPTPLGLLPGAYVMTSVINSTLSNQWLHVPHWGWLLTLASGVFAGGLLLFLTSYSYWIVALAFGAFFTVGGLASFSYLGLVLPWFYCCMSLGVSAVGCYLLHAKELNRRRTEGIAGTKTSLEIDYDPKTGLPKRIGRYHIIEKIGVGGMGEVYHARIFGVDGFQKDFAIKRISSEHCADPAMVAAFLEEARLNSLMSHPNIVQVFEFLRLEDTYLLVMEYVQGINLASVMASSEEKTLPVPISLAAYIVSEICRALEYAHRLCDPVTQKPLKIIHRDVSPQNILLTREGGVKLIDFGIAKGASTAKLTKTGTLKGKIPYMAPEQANGNEMDQRTDLFAAGLVLYELVTNRRAFEGKTELESLRLVRECVIEPPRSVDPAVPSSIEKIILKALQKDPKKRYATAGEMYKDLSRYLTTKVEEPGHLLQSEFLKAFHARASSAKTKLSDEYPMESKKAG